MSKSFYKIKSAYKNGKCKNSLVRPGDRGLFYFESLEDAGFVTIESYGEENVYFKWTSDDGIVESGYCKCL